MYRDLCSWSVDWPERSVGGVLWMDAGASRVTDPPTGAALLAEPASSRLRRNRAAGRMGWRLTTMELK